MDKTEIIQTFLGSGYQLNGEALNYFEKNPEKVKTFLDLAGGRLEKPVVTKQSIQSILSKVSSDIDVKIIKTFSSKQKELSVEDLTNRFTRRYEKISEILSKRKELMNLISVNRISQQTQKFSLIVMIKEIIPGDRNIVVEDPTGTTSVYISDEAVGDLKYLVEDEVVGLILNNEDFSENKAVKIVQPDIPLFTKVATSKDEVVCLFVSDVHMDDPKFNAHSLEKFGDYLKKIKEKTIVFVLGDVSRKKSDISKFTKLFPKNFSLIFLKGELKKDDKDNWLPDPVVVDVAGVKIFLSHGDKFMKYFQKFKTSPEIMMLQLIKKRHILPTFVEDSKLDDEKLFIDEVPDIFVIGHYHDPKITNYKGATIMSLGSFITEPVFWAINLKTRENIKINLT